MHKLIRLLAALMALSLLASACGGDENADAETAETTTSTTEAAVTTTTEVETTTSTTESTTTTTEAPDLGPAYPLTGEPIGEGDPANHAAVVIKVSNNDTRARAALLGLDKADIVFEERIEQQATRFASVFHSELPEEVGSVRSGRTSDIDIVSNLNRPVFAYSGANDGVSAQLRQAENSDLLVRSSADFGHSDFRRISGFSAPNNLVANAASLVERADGGEPPAPVFDYSNTVVEFGAPSPGVRVEARTDAFYVWSSADGGYRRFHDSNPHVTRDGVHITPVNVIVLSTTYLPSSIDRASVDAVTVGEGNVFVYSGGYRVEGTWSREFARDPFTLTTPEGDIIGLAPGQTWVSLTPGGTSTEISTETAESLLG